jgi:hypothetical protein
VIWCAERRGPDHLQLAVDRAALLGLLASGANGAEHEECGDDEPDEVPPVYAPWLEAARLHQPRRLRLISRLTA